MLKCPETLPKPLLRVPDLKSMSISSWASIELKHGKSNLSDVKWGRKVLQSIDSDDYIVLAQMMDKKSHPDYHIDIQTNIYGYAGYLWTISIHQFLGDTALHFALRGKKLYCVYMLIYLGADVTLVNEAGERPIDMLQGIYNMTYENMKYDAKRQLIRRTPPEKLPLLPKEFLHPADTSNVKKEAWSLMMHGCLLYTKLPKSLQRKEDRINTAHASPTTRRHLSFNLTSALKDWVPSTNADGNTLYINQMTGETSFAPPQGWTNVLGEIDRIRVPKHQPFVPKSPPLPRAPPIEDVWSRGDVSDIVSLIERQKQRYYQRKLPATQFTAQGLSLLSSVKLTSTHNRPNNPNPNSIAPQSEKSHDLDEFSVPLPAASLVTSSHATDKKQPSNELFPSLPAELLEAEGIAKLPFVKQKEDLLHLQRPAPSGQPSSLPAHNASAAQSQPLPALGASSNKPVLDPLAPKVTSGEALGLSNAMLAEFQPPAIPHHHTREIHEISTRNNLKYMKIGNLGAKSLASALADDPIVRKVILANARIADLGMHFLSSSLHTMWRLKYLDLSGNTLTVTSAQLLADTVLVRPKQLQVISLAGNRLGFAGVLVIIHSLFAQQQVLDDYPNNERIRRGIRWCSVKNNGLAKRDREALMKLFEEADFEAKRSSKGVASRGRGVEDPYPSIFQKRLVRPAEQTDVREEVEIDRMSTSSYTGEEDGKVEYDGDDDAQSRGSAHGGVGSVGRDRSSSMDSVGRGRSYSVGSNTSGGSGAARQQHAGNAATNRERVLRSSSVDRDNLSVYSHSTCDTHTSHSKSDMRSVTKKNTDYNSKLSTREASMSKKQVMFNDHQSRRLQSEEEEGAGESDSDSERAGLSTQQSNHLAGFEEDMDHWLTSSSDDSDENSDDNARNARKQAQDLDQNRDMVTCSESEISESLLRRRLRHQFALTVIV